MFFCYFNILFLFLLILLEIYFKKNFFQFFFKFLFQRSYEGKGMAAELILPAFQNIIVRTRALLPVEERIKMCVCSYISFLCARVCVRVCVCDVCW